MNVKVEEKDREVDMCKALRDMTDKAKNAGRAEGRAEGQVEGRAEGHAMGKAEGQAEELQENVINMAEAGMGAQTIAKILKKDENVISTILASVSMSDSGN